MLSTTRQRLEVVRDRIEAKAEWLQPDRPFLADDEAAGPARDDLQTLRADIERRAGGDGRLGIVFAGCVGGHGDLGGAGSAARGHFEVVADEVGGRRTGNVSASR